MFLETTIADSADITLSCLFKSIRHGYRQRPLLGTRKNYTQTEKVPRATGFSKKAENPLPVRRKQELSALNNN